MKKKLIIECRCESIFSEKESNVIKECLNYAHHRLTKHKCGISNVVNIKDVDKLRKELNKSNYLSNF